MALVFLWSYGSRFGAGASDMGSQTCDAEEEWDGTIGVHDSRQLCMQYLDWDVIGPSPPFRLDLFEVHRAGIYRSVSPTHWTDGTGKESWRRKEL